MDRQIEKTDSFANLSLLTPTELQEKKQRGELALSSEFSESEKKKIATVAEQIDFHDRTSLVFYGASAQNRLSAFASTMLNQYNITKLDEVGVALNKIVNILKTYNPSSENKKIKNLRYFFFPKKRSLEVSIKTAKMSFASVSKNIDELIKDIEEKYYMPLISEITKFEEMLSIQQDIDHELALYIAAGQEKVNYAEKVEFFLLEQEAHKSGTVLDSQKLEDFQKTIESFKDNLQCLVISRQLCVFNAASLRLLQENYLKTITKIKQFIMLYLPEWQMQMRTILGVEDIQKVDQSMKEAGDLTNDILADSVEELKGSYENASEPKETIDASMKLNNNYITTLNKELDAYYENISKMQNEYRIKGEVEENRNETLEEYKKIISSTYENTYVDTDINLSDSSTVDTLNEDSKEIDKKYTL